MSTNFIRTYSNIFGYIIDTILRRREYTIIIKDDDYKLLEPFRIDYSLTLGHKDYEEKYEVVFVKVLNNQVDIFYSVAKRIYSLHSISGDKEYFEACDQLLSITLDNTINNKKGIKSIQKENKVILHMH